MNFAIQGQHLGKNGINGYIKRSIKYYDQNGRAVKCLEKVFNDEYLNLIIQNIFHTKKLFWEMLHNQRVSLLL